MNAWKGMSVMGGMGRGARAWPRMASSMKWGMEKGSCFLSDKEDIDEVQIRIIGAVKLVLICMETGLCEK